MEKVDSIIILGININHKGLVQLHWSIQNSSCTLNVPMFALDIEVFLLNSEQKAGSMISTFFTEMSTIYKTSIIISVALEKCEHCL